MPVPRATSPDTQAPTSSIVARGIPGRVMVIHDIAELGVKTISELELDQAEVLLAELSRAIERASRPL